MTASATATGSVTRPDARTLLAEVLDAGSFRSWDSAPVAVATGAEYRAELAAARERSGVDEAVITGEGTIHGRRVAVAACEFAFLGGTLGVAAAERLTQAVERATAERLPLLAAPTSGGTRMQEGTVAFLQMVKIVQAISAHRKAGLPYLVYLRHPTTGGVFASWGSLGQVTGAEPGALIGFLGPRVYQALYGEPFPEGVQQAENLFRLGLIDAVVPIEAVPEVAARALDVLCAPAVGVPIPPPLPREHLDDVPAWDSIRRTRRRDRPHVRDILHTAARSVTELSGTHAGEREQALVVALALFGSSPCLVLGQDAPRSAAQPLGPGGLR